MPIFLLTFLVCFIVFLFALYALSHDDFILFRKNIDMEKVFNLAFVVAIVSLFFARLFFVFLYFKPVYLNPLAFVMFPYFPGLSLPGGLLGGSVALALLLRGKKYPEGRVFDLFLVAFLITLVVGLLSMFGVEYMTTKKISYELILQIIGSLVIFFFGYRASKSHEMQEGSIGLISIILLSLFFLFSFFIAWPIQAVPFAKESSIWIFNFLLAGYFFFKQGSVGSFFRFLRGK